MTKLTKAIERFFRDGQKEPSPLLEALREAAAEGLPAWPSPSPLPGWHACSLDPGAGDQAPSGLGALLEEARSLPDCPGLILDPEREPLYLSRDILDQILPSREDLPAGKDASALLAEGDALRESEEEDALERSLEAYRAAYRFCAAAPDLYIYPEVCMRLASFHPGLYSREELLSLTETAVSCYGVRVNAGDPAAPDLLVLAKRLQEQIQQRGDGKMKLIRNIYTPFL